MIAQLALGAAALFGAAAPPTTDTAGNDNVHLFTAGEVTIPQAETDELEIVLVGPADGSSVPMIVRNNSDAPLSNIEVTGIARDESGTLVATGSSQGFEPDLLEPGQWGIGYVYFDFNVLGGDEAFDFAPTGQPPRNGLFGKVPLTVTEAVVQPGDFTDRVVGVATNETDTPTSGPNSI